MAQPNRSVAYNPTFRHFAKPSLLAADVQIVASCIQRSFDYLPAVVDERAGGVANDFCSGKNPHEFLDRSCGFDDFIVGGFDARDVPHHVFDSRVVAACGNKRNVVFAKKFRDQAAGKTVGAVDDYGVFVAHALPLAAKSPLPNDTGRASKSRPNQVFFRDRGVILGKSNFLASRHVSVT
jgi:hypothetical protein